MRRRVSIGRLERADQKMETGSGNRSPTPKHPGRRVTIAVCRLPVLEVPVRYAAVIVSSRQSRHGDCVYSTLSPKTEYHLVFLISNNYQVNPPLFLLSTHLTPSYSVHPDCLPLLPPAACSEVVDSFNRLIVCRFPMTLYPRPKGSSH